MRNFLCKCVILLISMVLISGVAYAQVTKVSGNLKKLNSYVKIAVNPFNGNALIVWSQGNAKKNSYGVLYAAEAIRQPDGTFNMLPYFVVSTKPGGHRPSVVYLENTGKFLIAWDDAYYNLNEYRNTYVQRGHDFPNSKTYARTYTPVGLSPPGGVGTLGPIVTLNNTKFELNLGVHAVYIPT